MQLSKVIALVSSLALASAQYYPDLYARDEIFDARDEILAVRELLARAAYEERFVRVPLTPKNLMPSSDKFD
jgi:hypothetical protein